MTKYCKDCANLQRGYIGPLCVRGLHTESRESPVDGPYEVTVYDFAGDALMERLTGACGESAVHFKVAAELSPPAPRLRARWLWRKSS